MEHANADEAAAEFGIGMFPYRRGMIFDPPPAPPPCCARWMMSERANSNVGTLTFPLFRSSEEEDAVKELWDPIPLPLTAITGPSLRRNCSGSQDKSKSSSGIS
jgi:hypothetical protein